MQPNPILKPLALFLGVSGLLQGIVWFIAGILGVLAVSDVLKIPELFDDVSSLPPKIPTHNDYIAEAFRMLYFSDNKKALKELGIQVGEKTFAIFMILYIIVSFSWMLVSGLTFYMSRCSHWHGLRTSLIIYSVLVTGITCVDLTFMSMLVADYRKVSDLGDNGLLGSGHTYILTVIGIMFTLAARGYVLLLLNVVSVIYCLFYCFAYSSCGDDSRRQVLHNLPIDAYKEYPGELNFAEALNQEPAGLDWARAFTNTAFDPEQWDNTEAILQSDLAQEAAQKAVSAGLKHFGNKAMKQPKAPLWLGGSQSPEPDYPAGTEDSRRRVPKSSPYALPAQSSKPPMPPVVPPVPPPKPPGKFQKPQGKKGPPIPFPDYSPPSSPKELRPVIKPHSSYY